MATYVCRHQRIPPILEAVGPGYYLSRPPVAAFALAAAGLLLAGLHLQLTTKGDTAREAIRRAEQQYGPEYDYFVLSTKRRVDRVAAIVVAYNEREVRPIELEWQAD